jgi:hypothetical protein
MENSFIIWIANFKYFAVVGSHKEDCLVNFLKKYTVKFLERNLKRPRCSKQGGIKKDTFSILPLFLSFKCI